jgi:phosphatidylserine/phosphatidylglycerophosphate/cardiolipin synthase-like enzyme
MLGVTSSDGPNGSPQHDVHCRIQGPACEDLLRVFDQRWCCHPETDAIDRDYRKGPLVWRQSSTFVPKGTTYVRVTTTFNCVRSKSPGPLVDDDEEDLGPGEDTTDPEVSKRLAKKACKKDRSVADVLFASIEKAEKFIYVEEQYMIDLKVAAALNKAAKAGKHIIFLIPHSTISDLPFVVKLRKAFIDAALKGLDPKDKKAGSIKIYYLVDAKSGKIGNHCYVHAKTWIFDDQMAIIGSANCNRRGLSSDSEANVCLLDAPYNADSTAKALRKRLWREHLGLKDSVDIDDAVKARDLWQKKSPTSKVRKYDPAKAKDPPRDDDPEFTAYRYGVVDPDLDGLPACGLNDCSGCSGASYWA